MASGRQPKRTRAESERVAPEQSTERRASPRVLIGAAVVLALVVAGIVLALVLTGGSSDDDKAASTENVTTLSQAGEVQKLFAGIPEQGDVLGRPTAPVTMIEYADLQCPYCRSFDIESV